MDLVWGRIDVCGLVEVVAPFSYTPLWLLASSHSCRSVGNFGLMNMILRTIRSWSLLCTLCHDKETVYSFIHRDLLWPIKGCFQCVIVMRSTSEVDLVHSCVLGLAQTVILLIIEKLVRKYLDEYPS